MTGGRSLDDTSRGGASCEEAYGTGTSCGGASRDEFSSIRRRESRRRSWAGDPFYPSYRRASTAGILEALTAGTMVKSSDVTHTERQMASICVPGKTNWASGSSTVMLK